MRTCLLKKNPNLSLSDSVCVSAEEKCERGDVGWERCCVCTVLYVHCTVIFYCPYFLQISQRRSFDNSVLYKGIRSADGSRLSFRHVEEPQTYQADVGRTFSASKPAVRIHHCLTLFMSVNAGEIGISWGGAGEGES
jgi:hypothetical protein